VSDGDISAYSAAEFNGLSVGASNGGYARATLGYTFTIDPSYDEYWVDINIFADLGFDLAAIQFTREEYYIYDDDGQVIDSSPSLDYIFAPEDSAVTTTTFSFPVSAFPYEQSLILSAYLHTDATESRYSEMEVDMTTRVEPLPRVGSPSILFQVLPAILNAARKRDDLSSVIQR